MKKFILDTLMFVITFIVIIFILGGVASFDNLDRKTADNNNIVSLQNKAKYDSLDVLFVGNSYCYSGI